MSYCINVQNLLGKKNPPRVWILWIHDPFLDLPKQTQNPFLDSEIRILDLPKKGTLIACPAT